MSPLPLHRLPLPSSTLQTSLSRLALGDQPSAQRRSTTFSPSTSGVWARTHPLWAAWPLRITKSEVEEMGVDVDKGDQVSVDDVLRRWDPVEPEHLVNGDAPADNGLRVVTSPHRSKLDVKILGMSRAALNDSLPHLDVGDAVEICNEAAEPSGASEAREMLVDLFSGRRILTGPEESSKSGTNHSNSSSSYGPWSTRYCGHQFGSWAGQLGDGRAISILETVSPSGGRQEIQLKGAGRTPFSRTADGLAVLRSGIREFLGCEAVAALRIPTTRSLALLTSSSVPVIRENGPEPSSLLARVAPSFIRIGHFQALNPGKAGQDFLQLFLGGGWMKGEDEEGEKEGPLGGQGNLEGLREVAAWCRDEIMGMKGRETEKWVREVILRNAEMVAKWQVYGYCHGVLNTDNISVLGLTIDYGPYAFMDIWDEGHICNHSDPSGLYSYRNQPSRVLFALDKLVSALAPLIGYEATHSTIANPGWSEGASKDDVKAWEQKGIETMKGWEDDFWSIEKAEERSGWSKRFGLKTSHQGDNRDIFFDLLNLLHTNSMDFHTAFRKLCFFRPSRAEDPAYVVKFADDLIVSTTTSLPADSRDAAKRGLMPWLEIYAKRLQLPEEVQAWDSTKLCASEKDVVLYGEVTSGEAWEAKRETLMKRVNPRFVLRQWVLEETISELERTGSDEIREGRRRLAKVLDMATRPFLPWGENVAQQGEDATMCELGKREMLGFQCSCSS